MTDTRDKLVDTATFLFLKHGYGLVGTAQLCQAADVNKGSFYHFFQSKAALLVACIERYGENFASQFVKIAESQSDWRSKISAVFNVPLAANLSWKAMHGAAQGCLVGNATLELGAAEPDVENAVARMLALWHRSLTPIVQEALGPTSKDESAALIDEHGERLIAMLQGGLLLAKAQNRPEAISAMTPAAIAMLEIGRK